MIGLGTHYGDYTQIPPCENYATVRILLENGVEICGHVSDFGGKANEHLMNWMQGNDILDIIPHLPAPNKKTHIAAKLGLGAIVHRES
jgi:hypothetical protein